MADYTPEPRAYELMVLLSPELGDETLESEIDRVSNQLTGTGAEIVNVKSTTPWGRRRLAYPIQRHQDAFYVLYSVSSQPGQLDPFERELKLNNNVLRYLLIRQEEAGDEEEPEEAADPEEDAEAEESADEVAADEAADETVEAAEDVESEDAEIADEDEGELESASEDDAGGDDDERT